MPWRGEDPCEGNGWCSRPQTSRRTLQAETERVWALQHRTVRRALESEPQICAMLLVRHKTRKNSFFWKFWPSFVVGVVLTVVFIRARF